MACGHMDEHYMSRVQALDWERFYAEQQGFQIVATLKVRLREAADLSLIDARAGQADIGAPTTIQVADAVVLLFTANHQNVQGTANIARHLRNHPERKAQGFPDLRMLFIASRVFVEEERYIRWLKETAEPVYRTLLDEGVLREEDQLQGIEQCILAVDPRYSFEESLPVLEPGSVRSYLRDSYGQLAQVILDLHEGNPLWSTMRLDQETLELDEQGLRQQLEDAAERGDEYLTAVYSYFLGSKLVEKGDLIEAEALLRSALAYEVGKGRTWNIAHIYFLFGRIKERSGEYEQALEFSKKALDTAQATLSDTMSIKILFFIGLIFYKLNKEDISTKFLSTALKKSQDTGITDLQAKILFLLGALLAKEEKQLRKARKYFSQGLSIATQRSDVEDIKLLDNALSNINSPSATKDE
jgi:tetratricopeptide (TPR) repeat protein